MKTWEGAEVISSLKEGPWSVTELTTILVSNWVECAKIDMNSDQSQSQPRYCVDYPSDLSPFPDPQRPQTIRRDLSDQDKHQGAVPALWEQGGYTQGSPYVGQVRPYVETDSQISTLYYFPPKNIFEMRSCQGPTLVPYRLNRGSEHPSEHH